MAEKLLSKLEEYEYCRILLLTSSEAYCYLGGNIDLKNNIFIPNNNHLYKVIKPEVEGQENDWAVLSLNWDKVPNMTCTANIPQQTVQAVNFLHDTVIETLNQSVNEGVKDVSLVVTYQPGYTGNIQMDTYLLNIYGK